MRQLTLTLLAILGVCAIAPREASAAREVAQDTWLIEGHAVAGTQPDGNSLIIQAPDGLIVIDTGRHVDHTQQVLAFARTSAVPIRAIINSHWHLDHVGGNLLLRDAYPAVEVYATDAIDSALHGFLANYRQQLEGALAKAEGDASAAANLRAEIALIDAGEKLKPTRVVSRTSTLTIAGRPLELHVERAAVTAGDIWVFDPATRLLIAGDLVTLPAPFLDTACPQRWQTVLAALARKPFHRLIPGHGAPMDRAAFATYRKAFDRLLACGNDRKRAKSACSEGWLSDSAGLIRDTDHGYARALVDYYVDHIFRGSAPASNCSRKAS